MALARDMDIISNNIANMNTPGYRGQNLVFEEYFSDPKGADDELTFAHNRGQYQITSPGPVTPTNNPLDIVLNGPGFLGVQGANGETLYTRDGHFEINAEGTLLTGAGLEVAGNGGGVITIPAGSTEIKIDAQGTVSNQDGALGQIMVVEFADIQELEARGNNTYASNIPAEDATNTTVKQGYLEGSNVQAVTEITRMIETSRSFQSLQTTLQSEHDRLRGAIQALTGSR